MSAFRLSPSGPFFEVAANSDDVENSSSVPDAVTLTGALNQLVSPLEVTLYDDFIGGGAYAVSTEANGSLHIGALNWTFLMSGSTSSIVRSSNGAGTLRGLYAVGVPSSSTSRAGFFLGGLGASLDPENIESIFWRGYLNSDSGFSSARRMGLGLSNGADFGGDGIYVEHSGTISNNVLAVAMKAGVRTQTNTGIACPLDTYQIYELRRTASRVWEFYVNGVLGATLSGNAIPTVKLTAAVQAQGVINVTSAIGADTFQMTYRRRKLAA